MKTQKNLFLFFLIIVFIPLILSQGQSQQFSSTLQGCEIETPKFEVIEQGIDITYDIHIYNLTTGLPMSNITNAMSCQLHLYNEHGEHIYKTRMINEPLSTAGVINDFYVIINKGNFSTTGAYTFLVQCNGTTVGCFASTPVIVSAQGEPDTLGFFFLIIIVVVGILIFGVATRNIPVTMLGSFGCISLGLYIIIYGIHLFKDSMTTTIGMILLAVGFIWSIKAGMEYFDL